MPVKAVKNLWTCLTFFSLLVCFKWATWIKLWKSIVHKSLLLNSKGI